jgi:hypothetical protein
MVQPYKHEPFTDFSLEANQTAFKKGLADSSKNTIPNCGGLFIITSIMLIEA